MWKLRCHCQVWKEFSSLLSPPHITSLHIYKSGFPCKSRKSSFRNRTTLCERAQKIFHNFVMRFFLYISWQERFTMRNFPHSSKMILFISLSFLLAGFFYYLKVTARKKFTRCCLMRIKSNVKRLERIMQTHSVCMWKWKWKKNLIIINPSEVFFTILLQPASFII